MGESELLPNFTMFIQLGLFFICFAVLKIFVFTPYLSLLEARKAKTSDLKEKAIADKARAEKLQLDYETAMKAERRKLTAWMDDERKEAADEARGLIQEVRNEVSETLKHYRDEIQKEAEKARRELAPLALEYSSHIATKLVGREIEVLPSATELKKHTGIETTVPG